MRPGDTLPVRSGGRATAGRPFLQGKGGLEESPGSTKARRRITSARSGALKAPGRGIAPQKANRLGTRPEVRVKGWGKSPPRPWRQGWQGKPRLEQDRIGTGAGKPAGALSRSVRVGRARRSARAVPEEWSPKGRKALDRTRLTGRPIEIYPFAVDSFAAARESAKRLTLRELRRGYSQVVNHLSTTRTI